MYHGKVGIHLRTFVFTIKFVQLQEEIKSIPWRYPWRSLFKDFWIQSLAICSYWNSLSTNLDYVTSRGLIKPKLIYDSVTFSRKECPGINVSWRSQNKVHRYMEGQWGKSYKNFTERERNLQRKLTETYKGLGWKRPYRSPWSRTPFTTLGFSKPHTTWPWTLPGIGHPKLLESNLFQDVLILRENNFFLMSNLSPISFSLKPLLLALSAHALVKGLFPAFAGNSHKDKAVWDVEKTLKVILFRWIADIISPCNLMIFGTS